MKALDFLASIAHKVQSSRLVTLAIRALRDAPTRVKKTTDNMIAQLLVVKVDEIKHQGFCVDEFNTNQLQTEKPKRDERDFIAKVEDLEVSIKQLA